MVSVLSQSEMEFSNEFSPNLKVPMEINNKWVVSNEIINVPETWNNNGVLEYVPGTPPKYGAPELTTSVEEEEEESVLENKIHYYDIDAGEKPLEGCYSPPMNREFTAVFVGGLSLEVMIRVIGRQGSVFKAITKESGVDYIYHLRDQQMIAIWGYEEYLEDAVYRLNDQIERVRANPVYHANYQNRWV